MKNSFWAGSWVIWQFLFLNYAINTKTVIKILHQLLINKACRQLAPPPSTFHKVWKQLKLFFMIWQWHDWETLLHTMDPSHNSTCLLPTPRCVPKLLQASSLHKDAKFEAFIFIYKVSVWVSPHQHHHHQTADYFISQQEIHFILQFESKLIYLHLNYKTNIIWSQSWCLIIFLTISCASILNNCHSMNLQFLI